MTDHRLTWPDIKAHYQSGGSGILFIVFAVFLNSTDLFSVALGGGGVASALDLLVLLPMIYWLGHNYGFLVRGMIAVPELTALLSLAAVSMVWSVDPSATAWRLFPLFVTTATAMTLGSRVSLRTLIVALGLLAAITAIACYVAVATLPSARGIAPWTTTWRGAFNHKNGLGASSMFMLISATSAAILCRGRAKAFFALAALGAAFLLFQSESRTSQVISIISITALTLGILLRARASIWGVSYILFITCVVGLLTFLFASSSVDPIFSLIGREPTLSGRLPLWAVTWPNVIDRLWLGYGYAAFWDPDRHAVIAIARDSTIGYVPYYSHSGLIETLLNTGLVGMTLLAILLGRAVAAIFSGFRQGMAVPELVAALVILIAFVLLNLTESTVLSRQSMIWMVFVAVVTKLGNVAKAQSRTAARPAVYRWTGASGLEPRPRGER